MANPKGNPNLKDSGFKCDGEPQNSLLAVKVEASVKERVLKKGKMADVVRTAILEYLDREGDEDD